MKGKKKKIEEEGQDCNPGRELKKRKGSCTLRSPLASREISQDRKGASEAQRRVQKPVCGRQNRERPAQTVMPPPCVPQLKMYICWYRQELGVEIQGLKDRPRD